MRTLRGPWPAKAVEERGGCLSDCPESADTWTAQQVRTQRASGAKPYMSADVTMSPRLMTWCASWRPGGGVVDAGGDQEHARQTRLHGIDAAGTPRSCPQIRPPGRGALARRTLARCIADAHTWVRSWSGCARGRGLCVRVRPGACAWTAAPGWCLLLRSSLCVPKSRCHFPLSLFSPSS